MIFGPSGWFENNLSGDLGLSGAPQKLLFNEVEPCHMVQPVQVVARAVSCGKMPRKAKKVNTVVRVARTVRRQTSLQMLQQRLLMTISHTRVFSSAALTVMQAVDDVLQVKNE